jgi:endonuclease YncB( thermonuclease family)
VSLGPVIKDDSKPQKRNIADVLPEMKEYEGKERKMIVEAMKNKDDQTAVCRISYRPSLFQFFPSDVAEALIRSGNASVSSSLLTNSLEETGIPKTKALDASQRIQDLRKDVQYLDRLAKSEFEAAKASMGMWSVSEVRASKREVVEEVEFQTKANPFQKLWRWFRG